MTVHTEDKTTNQWGVSVSSVEDFNRWNWDLRDASVSIAAAELILREVRESTMCDIGLENGELVAVFGIFEYETNLTAPLLKLVDKWIESRRIRTGGIECTEEASAMADQLTEAAARLRREIPTKD